MAIPVLEFYIVSSDKNYTWCAVMVQYTACSVLDVGSYEKDVWS